MIGLLNAYHFDETPGNYQEKYEPMIMHYLQTVMPQRTIRTYLVAQNRFPSSLDECDGYIITGSPAGTYDDHEWIQTLIKFIKRCHKEKKKLVGICFGHQLIAHALGGSSENANKGWGIGVRTFDIKNYKSWMEPHIDHQCSLIFSHQDHVMSLPPEAELLGTDDFCEFQLYSVGEHIFSMQGHPEFSREYAQERYFTRKAWIEDEVYHRGIKSLEKKTDEHLVGKWLERFFRE